MTMKSPEEALAEMRGEESEEVEELPPTTTLKIDVTSPRGKRYTHDFEYTVPNLGAQVEIAKLKALWLPNGTPDINGASLVEMAAVLSITINHKGTPAWFRDMWKLYDATPITALYEEAASYEARFHRRPRQEDQRRDDEGVDSNGNGHDEGTGSDSPEDPLGEPVQPPAQRRKTLSSSRG